MTAGRVHRFGDNLTTDDIIAGKYKHETTELDRLAPHLMENVRPGFAQLASPGDFIVAGQNFGCGSSREQAPSLLAHAGIAAVVAPTFARIFFRNSINIGLTLLSCPTGGIEDGDTMSYDEETGMLSVSSGGVERDLRPEPLPDYLLEIVRAGGLLAYVRERGTL